MGEGRAGEFLTEGKMASGSGGLVRCWHGKMAAVGAKRKFE